MYFLTSEKKKLISPITHIETYKRQIGISCVIMQLIIKLHALLSNVQHTRTYIDSCINAVIHKRPAHHHRENLY